MNSDLPATGTVALLELLNRFVPDDFLNECWPRGRTGGRHRDYSTAQLYRVHLLSLLTPVHSVNLLVKLLPEQRDWRKFAGLRRQTQVPGVRVLHEFRARVGVSGLRRINAHLLAPLVAPYLWQPWSVGLIDATDLPAACGGFKKKHRPILRRARRAGRTHTQDRAKPLFCRLQEAHVATVAAPVSGRSAVGAAGELGRAGQCFRGGLAGAQPALLPAAVGLVSAAGRGRHGVSGGPRQSAVPRALGRQRPDQIAQRHETGATPCGLESGCLSPRRTADVVGLRWPGWGTLVWRRGRTGVVRLLLGSGALPATICPSARGT